MFGELFKKSIGFGEFQIILIFKILKIITKEHVYSILCCHFFLNLEYYVSIKYSFVNAPQ